MRPKKLAALALLLSLAVTGCGTENQPQDTKVTQTEDTGTHLDANTEADTNTKAEDNTDNTKEDNSQEAEADNSSENTLEGKVKITEETKDEEIKAEDGRVLQQCFYSIPVVTVEGNSQAADAINTDIAKRKESFLQDATVSAQEAKELYQELTEDTEKEDFGSYAEDLSYMVQFQNDKVLSILFQDYSFSGGAHGSYIQTAANYDLQTGERLTFDSFFTDKESALADIKAQVEKQCESPYYKERLFPDYEEYLDSVLVEDYWYFGKCGMKFISNQYMLAAYAAGSFEFMIPYSEIPATNKDWFASNTYIYPVPYGTSVDADLDGDGTKDNICYSINIPESETQEGEDGEVYEVQGGEPTCSLTINGTDFTDVLNKEETFYVASPESHYYLVDLDSSDNYVEIALVDHGYSDDPLTIFLRYDKGQLTCLGTIEEPLDSETCTLYGDGTLSAMARSSMLETISFLYKYQVKDGKLQVVPQEWYTIDNDSRTEEYRKHSILRDVKVYTENNIASDTKTLTKKDGAVTFVASDNTEWVKLQTEDGSIYYLHMEKDSFTGIDSAGESIDATEVFDNLILAG